MFHFNRPKFAGNRRNINLFSEFQMRTRLGTFNVDPYDLSIISQTSCPKDGSDGYNIHIDPDTFSSQNIGNAVRKVGEKIGDGVEWTINASKNVKDIIF